MYLGLSSQQTWVLTPALPSHLLWDLMGKLFCLTGLSSLRWEVQITMQLEGFCG